MHFQLFVGVLCLFLFCYVLLCVHFSFAIILKRKRKLVLTNLSVTITVLWLFLKVPMVGLQYVIVIFPDHKHLLSVSCAAFFVGNHGVHSSCCNIRGSICSVFWTATEYFRKYWPYAGYGGYSL